MTYAEKLAARIGFETLDYDDEAHWACRGVPGDVCTRGYPMARVDTDGTEVPRTVELHANPPVDCFFIYPTMDWQPFFAANHSDFEELDLVKGDIDTQAGPFSAACRVFAPFYRQGNIGAYATDPENGVFYFRRAFADVAAAFEHYLRHWNAGRPVVIFGHSQGSMHATFLLHAYFDGNRVVTDIPGSASTAELRDRLVAAMPIGGLFFVEQGKRAGGSLQDIPLCAAHEETGCVITYRSYPEGFTHATPLVRGAAELLNEEGFSFAAFEPDRHAYACVNPAVGPAVPVDRVTDGRGMAVPPGDVRLLEGTWLVGLFGEIQFGVDGKPAPRDFPRRYTAACREDDLAGGYLAVGLHAPPGGDPRGDPMDIDGVVAHAALGLHLWDINLAQGDLVDQVRVKSAAWVEK